MSSLDTRDICKANLIDLNIVCNSFVCYNQLQADITELNVGWLIKSSNSQSVTKIFSLYL
jgi:hypothetical protein